MQFGFASKLNGHYEIIFRLAFSVYFCISCITYFFFCFIFIFLALLVGIRKWQRVFPKFLTIIRNSCQVHGKEFGSGTLRAEMNLPGLSLYLKPFEIGIHREMLFGVLHKYFFKQNKILNALFFLSICH